MVDVFLTFALATGVWADAEIVTPVNRIARTSNFFIIIDLEPDRLKKLYQSLAAGKIIIEGMDYLWLFKI